MNNLLRISINNLGDKTFMIIKIEKELIRKSLLEDINKIIENNN